MVGTGTSIRQVAAASGVSPSTVSRYLRGELNVAVKTAARIEGAIAELGYKPTNEALASSRRPSIGLIIPNFTNPFFAALAESCTLAAESIGLQKLVVRGGGGGAEAAMLARLLNSSTEISGLVYGGMSSHSAQLDRAIAAGLPVVVIDKEIDSELSMDTITVDNYGGAFQATSYLLNLGHTRIAHVAGPPEFSTTKERLRGYRDAIENFGLRIDEGLIKHGPHSEEFGASIFPHLARLSSPPTAIFAGSDISAVGVLGAAELHGLRIPEDLSVVGCDGIRVGQWLRPKLTTLEQPLESLAQSALASISQQFNNALAGTHGFKPVHTVLPLRLVIRGSATGIPHGSREVSLVSGRRTEGDL